EDHENTPVPLRRKNSVRVGKKVISELLESDNVAHAVTILQKALDHLEMTQTDGEDEKEVSKVYSQIIRSLCDPNIASIVNEMSKRKDGQALDIQESILWRLFTKVVESGYVLERDAHLTVVNQLVEAEQKSLSLQAMYALPRREWDTLCYRIAVLLHLMQTPKQIQEAQGLLSDYGKLDLEIANPIAPQDLPPIHMEMPSMKHVTEADQFKLWMFYQAALSNSDEEWRRTQESYETLRQHHLETLERKGSMKDWAMEHFFLETEKQQIDRVSTDNDNTMIYVALQKSQFEYGWQVYQAMEEAVNESTPCIVMHLCWVAFRQIPIADITRRREWEHRAWSVYSRFMCSEYLHPEQSEAPGFLHDILSIAANSPESIVDKKARYTKAMSVYQLLVRLHFHKLLCDDRVLEPILCALLYECQGAPSHIMSMSNKAFEIWDRKMEIMRQDNVSVYSLSMVWALLVFCLKSGNQHDFEKILVFLLKEGPIQDLPSSVLAPIQAFHDTYACEGCYFMNYMFKHIEFTDDNSGNQPVMMNQYGFLSDSTQTKHKRSSSDFLEHPMLRTNIQEVQANSLGMAILIGASKGEEMLSKPMHYSTKKAKAIIRHCLKKKEM
ncbi:hypothetical protein CU098_000255, partial [Rhizopus stolonifer]